MRSASPEFRYSLGFHIPLNLHLYRTFRDTLIEAIINNREGVSLPDNLGYLVIEGTDKAHVVASRTQSFSAIREGGRKRYITNDHTDGKVFTMRWYSKVIPTNELSAYKNAFKGNELFTFKTMDRTKNLLYRAILDGKWREFSMQVDNKHSMKYGKLLIKKDIEE